MSASPTEQLVEDVAAVYFGAVGASTKHGVEIDDAGERGDATRVVLNGRLGAALHRLNPDLPHDTIEELVRILSGQPPPPSSPSLLALRITLSKITQHEA